MAYKTGEQTICMVFWKTYPLSNVIQSYFNWNAFKSLIFERAHANSPTGQEPIILSGEYLAANSDAHHYIAEICTFLKNNFGNPPMTPVLDIPEERLLSASDHMIILQDDDAVIVGCIRYHYLGVFTPYNDTPIYCVDCFCVRNDWRGRGVGDYLLGRLHKYVNDNSIPYSMFLKEGRSLSIIHSPLYSGMYVYRELIAERSPHTIKLTPRMAYALMDILHEFTRDLFIIRNIKTPNQHWRLYKSGVHRILACFQDAYQHFKEGGQIKKIAWCTAWIESSQITNKIRAEASKELSATMYSMFDYVWMNMEWIGCNIADIDTEDIWQMGEICKTHGQWQLDGAFNWYCYQWASAIKIKKSYCILN